MTRGVPISPPKDDRIERALANPESYFLEARKKARAQVVHDMETEQRRNGNGHRPRATDSR